VNEYPLPLWFHPGNRYKVTVCGHQRKCEGTDTEVVCEKSVEFRSGEGL